MDTWNAQRLQSKSAYDIQIDRKREPGRPKMTWKLLAEKDHREWKLSAIALMINTPGDHVCHECSKQATLKGVH